MAVVLDPVIEAGRVYGEWEEYLGTRPICNICGNSITEEYAYDIRGMTICPNCISESMFYIDD